MNTPEDILNKVKESILLSDIVGEHVRLSRKGKIFKGLCPFHEDKHPSMDVDDVRGRYLCWVCGASGDAIEWLKKTENDDFPAAVKKLADRAGIILPAKTKTARPDLYPLFRILSYAQTLYKGGLQKNEVARSYLKERGIYEKTCEEWGLGVVSKGILSLLKQQHKKEHLLNSGIMGCSDSGYEYERLRHRITIPICTTHGKLVGFSGRRIHEWDESPKYLNPPTTELFHKSQILFGLNKAAEAIRKTQTAIVVEGYFDVIALHQEGETRAIAGMGTAVTEEQLSILCRMTSRIVFCFDSDKGGRAGIRSLLPRLLSVIEDRHDVLFMFMPEGHDPDEFIRISGLDAWLSALNQSTPLSDILMQYVTQNFTSVTIPQKQRAAVRAEKVIRSVKNAPYLRQLLVNSFRNEYGISIRQEDGI